MYQFGVMQNLLFPTDFSPLANHAFDYALAFAKHYDAAITVVHVYHYSENEARLAPVEVLKDIHSIRKEEAFEKFQAYRDRAEEMGFRKLHIEPIVKSGFAGEIVLETCGYMDTDCIMIGCKGDSGWTDRLFGSVTLRIMRDAGCPVIAIPEKATFSPLNILFYAAEVEAENKASNPRLEAIRKELQAELAYVHIEEKSNKHIAQKLIRTIAELQADAVILSPQQHTFFENLLHPSITEQLTENLNIPIISIH